MHTSFSKQSCLMLCVAASVSVLTAHVIFPGRERQGFVIPGPMAEVKFWRARIAVLGGLYEQLSQTSARRVLAIVELGSTDRSLLPAFQTLLADLQKAHPQDYCRSLFRQEPDAVKTTHKSDTLGLLHNFADQRQAHQHSLLIPSTSCQPQMTMEARDNLKFLATLERHLGILESGPLSAVLDAIAPLLAALRLVHPRSSIA